MFSFDECKRVFQRVVDLAYDEYGVFLTVDGLFSVARDGGDLFRDPVTGDGYMTRDGLQAVADVFVDVNIDDLI